MSFTLCQTTSLWHNLTDMCRRHIKHSYEKAIPCLPDFLLFWCIIVMSVVNTVVICNDCDSVWSVILISKTNMCLFPVETSIKFLSYSRSLGLVSVSLCDRYDMMLPSTFTLLILTKRLLPRLPQTHSVHCSHQNDPSKQHSWPQKMSNHHRHHSSGWEHHKE